MTGDRTGRLVTDALARLQVTAWFLAGAARVGRLDTMVEPDGTTMPGDVELSRAELAEVRGVLSAAGFAELVGRVVGVVDLVAADSMDEAAARLDGVLSELEILTGRGLPAVTGGPGGASG